MQVTFGAATTFHEVNAILDGLGLALPILGSISDQTVAGAISTGEKMMLVCIIRLICRDLVLLSILSAE